MDRVESPLSAAVAANVRGLRQARRLTQDELASKMSATGLRWERIIVANLEGGRRANVTVDELAALAGIFGVEPWSLTTRPVCRRCEGAPPVGFICGGCGANSAA
jgi:transcriptional regulator with XRE-family HTH domain